ncbi:MAG TPA: hypothetical protein G4N93_02120 [Dehalococcoidia bacterium]|nr:hypothetical protein [Dehalococcoidia bacterium]
MSKETKNKTKRHPDAVGIFVVLFLVSLGLAALYGWWKLEPLYFTIPLYIIAVFFISIGAFGIVFELTVGGDGRVDRTNYAMAMMILVWSASLVYYSISTDITALHWLSLVFGGIFGFIALVTFIVQLNKDIRLRPKPTLGWITAIIIILVLYVTAAYYLERPAVLVLIPFTFVLLYVEYLRSTFLGRVPKEAQGSEVIDKSKPGIGAPYRSIPSRLIPRDSVRNLLGIRWYLYLILIFFLCLFLALTQLGIEGTRFGSFYEAVIYAYVGILAIVIAFAVLVIQRGTQKNRTEHLKRALEGLVQMYVIFALIAVTGLLLGTDINGEVLTRSVEPSEILGSANAALNICRILTTEFTILAFPAGLLYLHAMIKDFIRS